VPRRISSSALRVSARHRRTETRCSTHRGRKVNLDASRFEYIIDSIERLRSIADGRTAGAYCDIHADPARSEAGEAVASLRGVEQRTDAWRCPKLNTV
jgi:hypothetical protein